jgi:hypothetical protein
MFINSIAFSVEAQRFLKTGTYCDEPKKSPAFIAYWQEQLERCKNGYSIGETKITGDHYFYLNFCQIKHIGNTKQKNRKVGDKKFYFPKFWDGDYNYFWVKHIAKNGISEEEYKKLNLSVKIKLEHLSGGKHLILAKARRKGFSYKTAAIIANKYNTERGALSLIGAFDKKYLYPDGVMTKAVDYLNFLNENTGWTKKRDFINKQDHARASYKYTSPDGAVLEKGYKSQIIASSFKDNPDAGRGKDASLILLEEAGTMSNLKSTYFALKPTVEEGVFTTGLIICQGTGGDMEGGTIDFEDMFNDPETYGFMAFENIWDEAGNNKYCGFFFPDNQNKTGFIDDDGNSLLEKAKDHELAVREEIRRTAKDKKALDLHIVESALSPKEAFLRIKGNIFPGADLQRQLSRLELEQDERNYWIGNLLLSENHPYVEWKPNKNLSPIMDFPTKRGQDATGCVVLYEPPFEIEGQVPEYMYIAATDPYNQDEAGTGSLGSTFVYNRLTKRIVAEYSARPETGREYYEIVRRMLVYYNAQCMYENNVKGMFDYFEFKNCLYLLADEPQIIHDVVKDSHVSRKKGMHMTKELKTYGENLIKTWLIEPVDDTNPDFINLHKLRSQPLIKELIAYNQDDNFDRASAMMMLMYYIQELRKITPEPIKEIASFTNSLFFKIPQFKKPKHYLNY